MPSGEPRFQIESIDRLLVERLSDGSIAIFDQATQSVHSLNATSAVTFDACRELATLAEIQTAIEVHAGVPVEADTAEYAVSELQ